MRTIKYSLFKILCFYSLLFFLDFPGFSQAEIIKNKKELVDYVDPFIGSEKSRWTFFAPAALPFGMVKLAPLTSGFGGYLGGGNTTGYSFSDKTIYGFSHIHEWQLGGILVMPSQGNLFTIPGDDSSTGFKSTFSKKSEVASPGYYSVVLDKGDIKAELTATKRVGFHRYTFHKSDDSRILVDVGHLLGEAGTIGQVVEHAEITKISNQKISGFVRFKPSYANKSVSIYMVSEFSRPFDSFGMYRDEVVFPLKGSLKGPNIGFYGNYRTLEGEVIRVKVGLSYVGVKQAEINLQKEVGNAQFDEVVKMARLEWSQQLGRIEVDGGTDENKTKFYTALWHSLLGRGIANDFNGLYLSQTGQPKQIPLKNGLPEFEIFNSDSFWGSYWTLNQLWSLVYPKHYVSYLKYMMQIYAEGGWLPDGYIVNQYAQGMPANYATFIIGAGIMKGLMPVDHSKTLQAIKKNQNQYVGRPKGVGMEGLESYIKRGFIPYEEKVYGASSNTLEYAFQDWCASQIFKKYGDKKISDEFNVRSMSYLNLFDNKTKMFRPKSSDNVFLKKFDPLSGYTFAEGNAWQYLWFAPQDIDNLRTLIGSDGFFKRLQSVFKEVDSLSYSTGKENISGYYSLKFNPGNETGLHTSWLFNQVGRPELTQYYNRRIMDNFFGSTPKRGYGISQDEDQGQLASWFVLLAIGLFDIQGGCALEPQIQISTPLFDRVTINLDDSFYKGKKFTINVNRKSPNSFHIKSASLNGELLNSLSLSQNALLAGGQLTLDIK